MKENLLLSPNNRKLVIIFMAALIFVGKDFSLAGELEYLAFIKTVAEEIAALKKSYPQLEEFSIDKHADLEKLKIDFSYHTYEPERTGGWTSGVPNPHPDGVWFYIDLHDKDSTAQIHTQPISGTSLTFGDKNICFLILEGSETDSISGEMILIFRRNGAKLHTRRSN